MQAHVHMHKTFKVTTRKKKEIELINQIKDKKKAW
jgi:hypothetical protein